MLFTAAALTGALFAVTQAKGAALNHKPSALNQSRGDFASRAVVDILNRGASYAHKLAALVLIKTTVINQAYCFIFLYRHYHRLPDGALGIFRGKP